jgi:hypothetical protein
MSMSLTLLAVYCALAVSLMRAVLVKLQVVAPVCHGCGLPRERRILGERICACGHGAA